MPCGAVDWPLVVVGDVRPVTPYQRRLLALAGDRVRFIGGVYDADQLMAAGRGTYGKAVIPVEARPNPAAWRPWPAATW